MKQNLRHKNKAGSEETILITLRNDNGQKDNEWTRNTLPQWTKTMEDFFPKTPSFNAGNHREILTEFCTPRKGYIEFVHLRDDIDIYFNSIH